MKINLSAGRKAALSASMLALLFGSLGADAANLEGRWIQHPAAALRTAVKESQIDRIIEGNRYVYFSVRGALFNRKTVDTYTTMTNTEPLHLFIYDKTQPWDDTSILPMARIFELSGVFPNAMNYSPQAGVFAVAYDNNSIDFIYDDGTQISTDALLRASMPLQTFTVYSITFDSEKPLAYVAGSFGYVVINRLTGELENFVNTDKAVSWAARMGDDMVLFAGSMSQDSYSTKTYKIPASSSGLVKLTLPIEGLDNLQVLMPLTADSFGAIAARANDNTKSLAICTLSGNTATVETVAGNITADNGAIGQYRHFFHTDGYTQPGSNGYVVHSQDRILLLRPDKTVETIDKSALTAAEKASKAASLDGSKVWLYTYETNGLTDAAKRGFYFYDNSGSKWSSKSETASINAPSCTFMAFGDWNPEYGLLVRSTGTLINNAEPDYDKFSGLKDGVWTDYSFPANKPSYRETTLSAVTIKTDPLNPDWIWGSSNRRGVHRLDLSNYDNFLELGSTNYNSYKTTYPGYFPIFTPQAGSNSRIMFMNPDFDTAGNMWIARYCYPNGYYDSEDIYTAFTYIYYLTPEERMAMADIKDDASKVPDLLAREIVVPRTTLCDNGKILALKAPQNENYLFMSHCFTECPYRHAFIYDHNGTLDNRDDDRYVFLDGLVDENGEKVTFLYQEGIYEDPLTGEVWMMTTAGPFIINPTDVLNGNMTCRRFKITRRDGMEVDENPLEFVAIKYITDDPLGRKWLASDEGLYCLTADARELLGHYTVDNSPIPSNDVYNVICSPEGTVFALTTRGIAEFHPEGSMGKVAEGTHLSIYPSAVSPDYNGYITLSGAENGSEYVLCDAGGNEMLSLGTTDCNTLQWDARKADGSRMPAGRYIIRRKGTTESNLVVIL